MDDDDDYVKNEMFCRDSKMNKAIVTLFLEHRYEKVVSSCSIVIK